MSDRRFGDRLKWLPLVKIGQREMTESESLRWWVSKMHDEGFEQSINESDEHALKRYLKA